MSDFLARLSKLGADLQAAGNPEFAKMRQEEEIRAALPQVMGQIEGLAPAQQMTALMKYGLDPQEARLQVQMLQQSRMEAQRAQAFEELFPAQQPVAQPMPQGVAGGALAQLPVEDMSMAAPAAAAPSVAPRVDPTALAIYGAKYGDEQASNLAKILSDQQVSQEKLDIARRAENRAQEKDMREAQEVAKKEEASRKARATDANIVLTKVRQTADKLSQNPNLYAGAGGLLSMLPTSGAREVASNIETIKSALSASALQEMRANSPTGGALGGVSDKDLQLLATKVTNLDNLQDPAILQRNLAEVETLYSKILRDLGYKSVGKKSSPKASTSQPSRPSTPAPAPAGGLDVSTMSQAELERIAASPVEAQ